MDFTIKTYEKLVDTLVNADYEFITFEQYCNGIRPHKFIIMRHDADELAKNAVKLATIENSRRIKTTYFFRIVPQSNVKEVINKIVSLNHEIGYHYEDLSIHNGNYQKAIESFKENLTYFRTYYPVKTVCMHGSSYSRYDNRLLWQKYRLQDFGLIGEPYITVDFDKVYYLTDTGYAWDGSNKYATRDIVKSSHNISFHRTNEIINAINTGKFPMQCMILIHTVWSDNPLHMFLNIREFIRNRVKYISRHNKFVAFLYNTAVKAYWRI